jgi:flagellar basal-body rod protein FlgG
MVNGIHTATKNLHTKMKNIDIVANNLANINTIGYKREIPFSEVISREDLKGYTQLTDFKEGTFKKTNNPFDLAISKNGFFVVQTDRGEELTKSGKFTLSNDGFLVNDKGNKVLGMNGEINIMESVFNSQKEVKITKNGEIKVGEEVLDKLKIVQLDSQKNVKRTENQNYYLPDNNYQIAEDENFEIRQGYLEEANVNPVIEMQQMIEINQDFESAQKMVRHFDKILGQAQIIGRV